MGAPVYEQRTMDRDRDREREREEQQNGNGGSIRWEYFINHDKSASRVFDELCRGLTQIIVR